MNLYLLEIGAALQGASTTSLAIGTGSKTFTLTTDTIGAPKCLTIAGAAVVATYDGSNTMTGTVTSYDPATKALVINVASVTGSGTRAVWVIDITATLRFSSGAGYADPSAPAYYDPRLVQPAWLRRTAFANNRVGGAVEAGLGEAILANGDAGLDILRRYGFSGKAFALLVGDETDDYGDFVTELSGVVDQATHQWAAAGEAGAGRPSQILFRLRDRIEDLRKPVQGTRYAGTGTLEGAAQDIKGHPKPVLLGRVYDASPVCVNTTDLIYQLNDGALNTIDAVYVGGLALVAGADYPDQATLLSTAPAANQYRKYVAGGYFRLGTAPTGPVTADATEGANTAARTTAQILKKLAIRPNGIASGDVNSSDVTALDTASNDETGIYIAQDATILDCMNAVAPSAGAWFGFDRDNDLRMKQLAAPGGSPAVTLKSLGPGVAAVAPTVDILALERTANQERDLSVPVWRVVVHYQRCWTTLPSGFDATITDARKAFLAQEFRSATAEDSAVKTKHPAARELNVVTLLTDATDASAEASRLLTLHKAERDLLQATVTWDSAIAALVDLGSVVQLEIARYGYDSGALFAVVGIERDARAERGVLGLWG